MDHKLDTKVAEIDRLARLAAPPSWASITIDVWANVMAFEVALSAQNSSGRSAGEMRHVDVTELMQALRADMYEPDCGAWLSARFVIHRDHENEASFNYNDNPDWTPSLHPMMFVRDLEAYPRALDRTPRWLREVVALGRELERGHEAGQSNQ